MICQYASFEIQSPIMKNLLTQLQINRDKKFFVVVGEVGSGRSTMINYINKLIFSNQQRHIFDDCFPSEPPTGLGSAIVATTRESAYEVIRNFDKNNTCVVDMPSLAERKADIAQFAAFFIDVLSVMGNKNKFKLTEKAVEKLLHYNWPGNFHELEAVLEKAFYNAESSESQLDRNKYTIEPEHIELNLQTKELEFSIGQKLEEVERKYILQTLYFAHQNRTKAAEILGISIRTLRNKINQYREEGYL